MSDPRVQPDPALVDREEPARVADPIADLLRQPNGARDRQLLLGDRVTKLGQSGDFAYVRAARDGYLGFVKATCLGPSEEITHRVHVLASHVYEAADIKSMDVATLSLGSGLSAISERADFVETTLGFVPKAHLSAPDAVETDPVEVAERFLGTPYLWGGNSRLGLDCSGLVQIAALTCGRDCPGDSDQQQDTLGELLDDGAPTQRGDLYFWPGHVAMAYDATHLIHANAHHMAVVIEPIAEILTRIERAGAGPLLARKRWITQPRG